MTVAEIDKGERFCFNGHQYTKGRKLCKNNKDYNHDIYDCTDEEMRHRPFRDDVEIEPLQYRINDLYRDRLYHKEVES